jgi:hypothetical protein
MVKIQEIETLPVVNISETGLNLQTLRLTICGSTKTLVFLNLIRFMYTI